MSKTEAATAQQDRPAGKGREILPLVISDLKARQAKGIETYGEALRSHNGRDSLVDAYQEACDLALYLRQALEERDSKP